MKPKIINIISFPLVKHTVPIRLLNPLLQLKDIKHIIIMGPIK